MRHHSFIIAALALACFVGKVQADTTKLLAADGWTKVTTLPTASDIASNYYVFVDNTRDLMLGIGKGVNQNAKWYSLGVYYRTSVDPTAKDFIPLTWTLEAQGTGFAMRNLDQPVSPFQTEWNAAWKFDTNDVYATANDWCKVTLTYLPDGYWTIQNGYYPSSGYLGPWTDSNFTNGAECAANKSGDNIGKFQIYAISRTQFKQNLLDNASESNPVDLTPFYVTNATFDANNRTGWTEEGSGGNNNTAIGCEIWHRSSFKIYQDLTLPNGKYRVSLQIAGTTGVGQVYGTSGSTTKTITNTAAAGDNFRNTVLSMIQDRTFGQVTTDDIEVANGSLQMGMKCETTDQWLVFDNFKLYCTGVDLSAYVTQLADLVNECNDFIDSGVVPEASETAIASAITTYNNTYETAKEYSNAIVALTAALNTYRNDAELQAAYAAYYAFKSHVDGLMNGVDEGDTKTTLTSAINTATNNVEAATTVADINTQKANLRAAAMTFISTTDGQFDITFLASQAYSDWKKKDGSAAGIVADQFLTNRPSTIPSFAESYETTCATTGTVLYQTIADLPAGYYQVGMYAAAMYTSGRGFDTEATEGDANRTYAFAGNLNDAGSILRTGTPISFNTVRNFDDLTTLDVNVHLSSDGSLTFGVQKDANGSNWHFAQIMSIIYSNTPDLTNLKATRDVLVAEAQGLLNSSSDYLTSTQQTALQSAITAGDSADDFDALNTVTLTTLPDAINTAKQQVTIVKANRGLMLAALERFETDYNLADGTDYRRATMSAGAWTDLLTKVNAVSTALDNVELSSNYATVKNELIAQMDATDASLRLFKNYKAMVDGTTALSIAGDYGANSNMDSDATEQTAITALNTAFTTYATAQDADFNVSDFLGENLDFSATAGSTLNSDNSNTIQAVTGWEVAYTDADTWAVLQTNQNDNAGALYIRKNWGSAATKLTVSKHKMLPVGKYRLSLSWNSTLDNMTNLSAYVLDDASTAIGETTTEAQTLTYDFEVTGSATPFDIAIGFQKTGTGNTPAQIIVDNITLTCLRPAEDLLTRDYDPAALWFDATDSKYASATDVTVTPTAPNQIIKAATASQFSGLTQNVIVDGTCANLVITDGYPLEVQEAFTATDASYSRTMSNDWGTLILPFAIASDEDVQLYRLKASDAESMTFELVDEAAANCPVAFKKLSGNGSITITGSEVNVAATSANQADNTTADDWSAEGSYSVQTITSYSGVYYIAANKFWAADDNISLNPFRAIYRYAGSNSVKQFSITVDTPTGIDSIKTGHDTNAPFYNLAGQRVQGTKLSAGVYIRNGKKIILH